MTKLWNLEKKHQWKVIFIAIILLLVALIVFTTTTNEILSMAIAGFVAVIVLSVLILAIHWKTKELNFPT